MSKDRSDAARRTARGSRKRRARPTKARKLAPPVPAPPVDEADRALPQPEGGRRARGPKAERSVQDPLGDWPETDADRWLLDREGEGVEAPGDGEGVETPDE
jgi:hypothetical protein